MLSFFYPGGPGNAPDRLLGGATMIGFCVDSVDSILAELGLIEPAAITSPKTGPKTGHGSEAPL